MRLIHQLRSKQGPCAWSLIASILECCVAGHAMGFLLWPPARWHGIGHNIPVRYGNAFSYQTSQQSCKASAALLPAPCKLERPGTECRQQHHRYSSAVAQSGSWFDELLLAKALGKATPRLVMGSAGGLSTFPFCLSMPGM